MGVLPRHQNFQHILLFIRKWICALELFLSEMLHQTLESHATHLNQLPLWWHLLACSTVKAASHDGSSVVPIYFSQTDVVCSSLLCYFLDSPGLYYSIFHWLKLHLFGSHSWVLFFSLHSSTSSVHYFFFSTLWVCQENLSVSPHCEKWTISGRLILYQKRSPSESNCVPVLPVEKLCRHEHLKKHQGLSWSECSLDSQEVTF